VEEYYNLLTATLRRLRPGPGSLVILGDFNVNLSVGDKGPKLGDGLLGSVLREGESSRHSQKLLTFCQLGGYVLPQTFGLPLETVDSRSWATWRHPRTGQPHVKDLILVPRGESGVVRKSSPDWKADLLGSDHSPLVCCSGRKRGPKAAGPRGETLPQKLRCPPGQAAGPSRVRMDRYRAGDV
jgi:hypothetical protein